jgi:plastocyanin
MQNAECRMNAAGWLVLLMSSVLSFSCDHSTNTAALRPTVPAGTCVVRGVVKFSGPRPEVKVIGGSCCPGSPPVMSESLVVNADGSLKNVVVFIKDGPNLAMPALKDQVLTQKDCQYVPHVLAMQTGQNLIVSNHDPTTHNVLIQSDKNPGQNLEEQPATNHTVHFDQPDLVRFACSVHPWMSANVYVFDHPCFAVTGDDGRFEIPHLPAGTYTLVAWQEELGTQEMTVTVSGDKPAEVNFDYHP